MKILITGGAGFIGSNLIADLLEKSDDELVCVDDFNDYYDPKQKEKNVAPFLDNPRFKLYKTDIRDFDALKRVFVQEKPDKVIHLAARAGVRPSIAEPLLYQSTNVQGTLNLLELSRLHGVKNFIFGSSSSVYGNQQKLPFAETDKVDTPISPYAATKKAGENLAHAYHHLYGMPITCLRFFTVYGPSGRPDMAPYLFTKKIYEGSPIQKFGEGLSARDYTYVDDIVQGITAALSKDLDFEIINLGNSNAITLNAFITLIEGLLGKQAQIEELPMQPGDVNITYADITKAKALLDYNPATSIEQGMEKFVDWYIKNL